jgi:polysaccharide pyruvyl transferase WcaK-like protein
MSEDDEPSAVLVASTFGDAVSGGGLFSVEGSRAERIDRVSSVGLAFDGRRLARSLHCSSTHALVGEIIVYDPRGVQRYLRLDDTGGPHDVAWDGEQLVVVSAWSNAVRWLSPAGEIVREIRYPGPADSWHINCVTRRDDVWYATMFGDLGAFRGGLPQPRGKGRLVNLVTGSTVVDGLSSPHTPRWIEGLWLVCNSDTDELMAFDEGSGRVVRRVGCGNWTRGFAHDEDFFYVGACQRRATQESFGNSYIVVIDRQTWEPVDRIAVPAEEIYDLVFVPRTLLAGLRRGFDVNPLRSAEFRQYRVFDELGAVQPRSLWPSGDPLAWSDFRCTIACDVPRVCTALELLEIPLTVTNRSNSFFTSAPPAPVYVSYKWLDPQTGAYLSDTHAYRSRLPRTLFPSDALDMTARVVVPDHSGPATVRITLMQEGVSWFDDQDPGSALEFAVNVVASDRPPERVVMPIVTPEAAPLSAMPRGDATRIFVGHNFFGAGNFGDDLMLAGFLSAAPDDVELIVCTPHDIFSQIARFPHVRWLPEDAEVRQRALRDADIWLGLGDTPFQLDSGPWLLDHNLRDAELCTVLGKPMYFVGVGCESPAAAADPRARATLAAAEHIWVRDERSLATLRPYVEQTRISLGADLSHLSLAGRARPPREAGTVGLLLAFEDRSRVDLAVVERFITAGSVGSARWLVQEARPLPFVERWLLSELRPDVRARLRIMDVDYRNATIEQFLDAFGTPEVTITSRYHGALIAAWHDSKVLVVPRSAKLQGIADEFALGQVDRIDSLPALESFVRDARSVPREHLLAARDRAQAMCGEFFRVLGRRLPT